MVTFAPFWSNKAATAKVRVVVAFAMALALAPAVAPRIETPPSDLSTFTLILFGEAAIGLVLGFVGRIVFSAFEVAAHLLGSQMGFSLAGTIDPSTQAQTAAFGMIAQMLGLMVLLGADGHHWFLAATMKSFSNVAPGSFSFSPELLDLFLRLSADALVVGLSLAAPAIVVLLSIEFALEYFGRTAPQFQMFILGFPVKIGVGLVVIGSSLYLLPAAYRDNLGRILVGLTRALNAM